MQLTAVNSINWARVMAQAVYYVTVARALRRPITACVPTGNFGNIFAGWVAQRMGAPIADFIVASNANDILTRFVNDGDMSIRPVIPTTSPSMDIQVSSNFERLLFEMNERDGLRTAEQLARFRQSGRLEVAAETRKRWIDGCFRAARYDDAEVAAEMRRVHEAAGLLIDPHTATGTAAARRFAGGLGRPTVTMATAHPAKFPDAVERATGVRPALPRAPRRPARAPGAHRGAAQRPRRRRGVRGGDVRRCADAPRGRSRALSNDTDVSEMLATTPLAPVS